MATPATSSQATGEPASRSPGDPAAVSPPPSSSSRVSYESGSSLRSLFYLVVHQVTTRVVTFLLNLLVARHLGPAAYGIAAVHLYLLNTTLLFTTREACRRATLRYAPPAALTPEQGTVYARTVLVNLAWLAIVGGGLPLCWVVRAAFLHFAPTFDSESTTREYAHCVTLYALASFLELVSEPLYLVYQKHQRVRARVLIDAAAVLARCVVTFLWMKFGRQTGGGLVAFAYGQMTFAGVIVAGYYGRCAWEILTANDADTDDNDTCKASGRTPTGASPVRLFHSLRDLFPQRLGSVPGSVSVSGGGGYTDASLVSLTGHLQLQSLEKLALTEGEKFVLVSLNSDLDAQGVYGLIQNLGSLAARIVFQPVEEAAFMEFSLQFAQHDDQAAGVVERAHAAACRTLCVLLHFVSLLGLLLVSFGPAYAYVLLDLLYGAKWSTTAAPQVLSCYCVYLLFMSVNGVTEAFVQAVMAPRDLQRYNLYLVGFSAVYLAACAVLLPYGPRGLIAANGVNMAMRIAYSAGFIRRFFAKTPPPPATATDKTSTNGTSAPSQQQLQQQPSSFVHQLSAHLLPDPRILSAFLLSLVLTNASFYLCSLDQPAHAHSLPRFAAHVGVGVGCLSILGGSIWQYDRAFLVDIRSVARRKVA